MTRSSPLVIGSRGSQLALWQATWVQTEIQKYFPKIQIRIDIIKTTGDKILDSPLSTIGDMGLFTKEIERALLEHDIDLAVHSLKDLPTMLPEGLTIGAISRREDVRDVFISHPKKRFAKFTDLPTGAIIATGSLRRKSQLLNWRSDLSIVDVRGNLNTRFSKLDSSNWDGMILARAGVVRLGMEDRITEVLPLERILPAVGQGALAIEIREEDEMLSKLLAPLASPSSTITTTAERTFLHELEGGCQIPVGAYARIERDRFIMDGMIGSLDGKNIVRGKTEGLPDEGTGLAIQLAQTLLKSGGKNILESIRSKKLSEVPAI